MPKKKLLPKLNFQEWIVDTVHKTHFQIHIVNYWIKYIKGVMLFKLSLNNGNYLLNKVGRF